MENIPKFIRWKILDYLEIEDKLKLDLLNKKYNEMINDNNYWKQLCKKDFQYEEKTSPFINNNLQTNDGEIQINFKETYISFYNTPFFPFQQKDLASVSIHTLEPYRLKKSGNWLNVSSMIPYSKGRKYIELKIKNSGGKAICLGISSYFLQINSEKNISYDKLALSYNPFSKKIWNEGKEFEPHLVPKFQDGSTFGILFDFEKTFSIFFFIDRKFFCKPLSFKGNFNFYPAFGLGNDSEVKFVNTHSFSPPITEQMEKEKSLLNFGSTEETLSMQKNKETEKYRLCELSLQKVSNKRKLDKTY
eukprot:TRINITY_DN3389_c0_g2_i1.p1 TRINITY_DN3389_c0_g2~~TRINITY_DN3389_c0_g2_i1.p1  ORF type:complete len:304 (-),score=76.62 TRINITY_DN3389_c0_g2_i1:29-940(-)